MEHSRAILPTRRCMSPASLALRHKDRFISTKVSSFQTPRISQDLTTSQFLLSPVSEIFSLSTLLRLPSRIRVMSTNTLLSPFITHLLIISTRIREHLLNSSRQKSSTLMRIITSIQGWMGAHSSSSLGIMASRTQNACLWRDTDSRFKMSLWKIKQVWKQK